MTLEGVVGIVEGLNPTLIRMKLEAFDQHPVKPKKGKAVKGAEEPAKSPASAQTAPAGD
jgi:hypothetical protein